MLEAGASFVGHSLNVPAVLLALAALLISWSYSTTFMGVKAPYAGYSSILVPGAWVRFQFTKGALQIINDGYKRVLHQWKNVEFKLSRTDRDILVIPNKYVEELRNLPGERLSSMVTLVRVSDISRGN
ncbi:MAG: hypothetical protein Q9160_008217 [Pyrenula sp. 1 TL-2023]